MLIKTCLLQGMGLSRGPEEGSLVCLALPGRFRQTVSRGRLGSGVKKKQSNIYPQIVQNHRHSSIKTQFPKIHTMDSSPFKRLKSHIKTKRSRKKQTFNLLFKIKLRSR